MDRKNVDADDVKESKNSKAIAIKNSMDPLTTIRKYIGTETVKRSSKVPRLETNIFLFFWTIASMIIQQHLNNILFKR